MIQVVTNLTKVGVIWAVQSLLSGELAPVSKGIESPLSLSLTLYCVQGEIERAMERLLLCTPLNSDKALETSLKAVSGGCGSITY